MKNLKIFRNAKVVVTGHTGFKGSWLTAWLKELDAKVMGISLNPQTSPSNFIASRIGKNIKDAADFLSRMGPMSVPFENSKKSVQRKVIDSLEECFINYSTREGVEMHFGTWIVKANKS